MNGVIVLRGAEPGKVLQIAVDKKVPAIISYLSGADSQGHLADTASSGKWYVAKVLLSDLIADRLYVETSPRKQDSECEEEETCLGPQRPSPITRPINLQINQQVGVSFKYEYGKFIFDATVLGFEPLPESRSAEAIVLTRPYQMELVQRRNYFRINVPTYLKVGVLLWHRRGMSDYNQLPPEHCYKGELVDVSAGGMQVGIGADQRAEFRTGQFVGLQFTPTPYESPLKLTAQIRSILPTADDKNICLGLQLVGLEASPEGREVLQRLCSVAERYHQMNRFGIREQDFQTASF